MRSKEVKFGRSYDVELKYGEDFNSALRDLCATEGVKNAMVTSGLGGFDKYTLIYAGGEQDHWEDGQIQLAAVTGMIADGEPNIGVTVTLDGKNGITRSGRVGENATRLFYCELMVTELLDC